VAGRSQGTEDPADEQLRPPAAPCVRRDRREDGRHLTAAAVERLGKADGPLNKLRAFANVRDRAHHPPPLRPSQLVPVCETVGDLKALAAAVLTAAVVPSPTFDPTGTPAKGVAPTCRFGLPVGAGSVSRGIPEREAARPGPWFDISRRTRMPVSPILLNFIVIYLKHDIFLVFYSVPSYLA